MVRCGLGFLFSLTLIGCLAEEPDTSETSGAIINAPTTTLHPWTMLASPLGSGCSTSMLTPHWLMTSAHCIEVDEPTTRVQKNGVVLYDGAAQAYKHPDYGGSFGVEPWVASDTDDDFALIQIYGPGIQLAEYARIGTFGTIAVGEVVTIAAFGHGSDPGSFPSCEDAGYGTPRAAQYTLKTVEYEKLEADWGDHEICPGDSGSPWSIQVDGRHTAVGLTANRRPYHDVDAVRIEPKISWVESMTATLSNKLVCPTYYGGSRHFVDCFEPPQAVTSIAAGSEHACATLADMSVRCWGRNSERQLGVPTFGNHPLPVKPDVAGATAVAAGDRHSCALTNAGSVVCWGDNSYGQRGNGGYDSGGPAIPAEFVRYDNLSVMTGITKITAGGYHSCALTSSGLVYCWGYGALGALGNGTTTTSPRAQQVGTRTYVSGGTGKGGAPLPGYWIFSPLTDVVKIDVGTYHTCATRTDGTAYCWGYNGWGQLGDGTYTTRTSPVRVWGLTGATSISAGMTTTCASRSSEPKSACWGSNASGQFGDGAYNASHIPRYAYLYMTGALEASVGLSHACYASDAEGRSLCAGSNSAGAMGMSSTAVSPWFTQSNWLPAGVVKTMASGDNFSCWQADRGFVYCSGRNSAGQIGQANFADTSFPYVVQSLNIP